MPISSDINDLSALTPGHFLIGDSLIAIPEPNYQHLHSNRLSSWQLISKLKQDFWKRWSLEYSNELNIRHKYKENTKSPSEGMHRHNRSFLAFRDGKQIFAMYIT